MSKDVCSSLINYCRSGNLVKVKSILSHYSLCEYPKWSEGYLLVCEALKNKQIEIAKVLLQNEAKVNVNTKSKSNSHTPLHYAVYIESIEIIQILLDKEADINATNKDKRTPLHVAVEHRKEEIVKLLMQRGANVGLIDKYGYTSLHLAAKHGDLKIIQHLINYGADVNCIYKMYMALYFAIEFNNLDIVKLLLQNNAMDHSNYTTNYNLLHLAVRQDNVKILKLLLEYFHNIDETFGQSVLQTTLEEKVGVVKILFDEGYSVNDVKSEITSLNNATDTRTVHKIEKVDDETSFNLLSEVNANCLTLPTPPQVDLQFSTQQGNVSTLDLPILEQENKQMSAGNTKDCHTHLKNGCTKVEDIVVRSTNVDFSNLLHTALIRKQKEIVKVLLNHGFDANGHNEFGRKPIYYAYKYNDLDMCKHLLLHGACINSKIDQDFNLLHMAVENRDEDFVKFVLKQGADVNATMNDNSTSLHIASRQGCEQIVKLLLKYNADVHIKDNRGFIPLHEASKQGNEKIVKLLLRKGSDVDALTNSMSTSLHFAVQYNREQVMPRLLKYGADVNLKDNKNKTALCYAADIGNTFAVCLLLNQNLDFNEKSHKLAFCLAILGNFPEHSNIVEIFLFRGFNIISQDFSDFPIPEPLHSRYSNDCNREEYVKILKGLLKREPSANAFFEYQVLRHSIEKGFLKIVKDLLRHDVNLNISLEECCTLLHIAVMNGQIWIAEELLNRGANVNAVDIRGRTALHTSILNNFTEIVAFLIKQKVDFETRDEDGKTALHLAADDGKDHIVRLLLNAGANVNSKSSNESRPLHFAAERGHIKIVELLLDYDAEINVKNRSNETPLDLAVYWQKAEVVSVLLENGAMYNASFLPSNHTDIFELLAKHSIKLQEISMGNDEMKFGQDNHDFRSNCKEEVQRILLKQIGINVSLYDILTKGDSILEMYARNKNIIQFFDFDDYKTSFPIYANLLRIRFNRAKRKNRLKELATDSLEVMLEMKIPYLAIEKLFSYVSNTDLRNLICAMPADGSNKKLP